MAQTECEVGGYSGDTHYILFGVPDYDMGKKYKSMVPDERYFCYFTLYFFSNYIPDEYYSMDCGKCDQYCRNCRGGHITAGTAKSVELGRKNFIASIVPFEKPAIERFSDKTMNDIVKASFEMGKVKTGALMVIEQHVVLTEYERTGIEVDGIVSSQLLINIFEHNTPLHDGAVIIRGNRVVSATCYLPLSDNMEISKELGTRHRAAVGISEVTDALTIVVSEETGHVSVTYEGMLYRNLDANGLREKLRMIQNKEVEEKKHRLWKGRAKDEK